MWAGWDWMGRMMNVYGLENRARKLEWIRLLLFLSIARFQLQQDEPSGLDRSSRRSKIIVRRDGKPQSLYGRFSECRIFALVRKSPWTSDLSFENGQLAGGRCHGLIPHYWRLMNLTWISTIPHLVRLRQYLHANISYTTSIYHQPSPQLLPPTLSPPITLNLMHLHIHTHPKPPPSPHNSNPTHNSPRPDRKRKNLPPQPRQKTLSPTPPLTSNPAETRPFILCVRTTVL